uniref:Conotoxin Cal5.2 n=1 Tax=Californiconus californicus TaxID=1736779 RepID=CT52_CONCL|nr:RecName: Full=Conotoxin Cal5.2; Flags: Precursor [Californiconus californicus]ADB43129.1 conotoxin Cal 5.2 precursor [Californiconus californicus]
MMYCLPVVCILLLLIPSSATFVVESRLEKDQAQSFTGDAWKRVSPIHEMIQRSQCCAVKKNCCHVG